MSHRAAIALVILTACGSEQTVEVGPEADWVAFVRRSASGAWIGAAGLMRIGDRARASIRPDETVFVAVWSDEALGAQLGSLPDDAIMTASAVVPRATCEPALPRPLAIESVGLDQDVELPQLTTRWAFGACTDIHVAARVICGELETACPVRVVERSGCSYTLDFGCELGSISLARAEGEVCPTTPGCVSTPEVDGRFTLVCEATCAPGAAGCGQGGREVGCRAEVHVDARFPIAPSVTRVKVGPGPPATPPVGLYGDIYPVSADSGYLGTPVVIGDRVVVPFHDFRALESCGAGNRTTLVFVATETASIAETRVSEVCLEAMVKDPSGPGFLGLYGDRGTLAIGRFDARGQRVAGTELVPAGSRVVRPLLAAREGLVAVSYVISDGIGNRRSHLRAIDPSTLAVTHARDDVGSDISALTLTDHPYIVAGDDFDDLVIWWSPDLSVCVGSGKAHLLSAPLPQDLTNLPLLALTYLASPRQILALVNEQPAIRQLANLCEEPSMPGQACAPPGEGSCVPGARALPIARGFEPIRARSWPALDRSLAVSGTIRPVARAWIFQAVIGAYDPVRETFAPGLIELGPGIARDLVVDEAGALWVTLPWSAEIVRLSP